MLIFPKRFLSLSNYRSALFLHFMEKVKWNKHFFQFTVPEKEKMKKKKTQKSNLLEMAIKAKKKSTQSHSLWKLDFPVMDQIKSPQNMSQKQVEYDIPLFHFLTILTKVTFRLSSRNNRTSLKKIKKKTVSIVLLSWKIILDWKYIDGREVVSK